MSSSAQEITWAGGTHVFDLNSRRVSWMLQQAQHPFPGAFGDTPAACLRRFEEQIYSPDDVSRILRIGLIGGGMSEAEADAVIAEHVSGQPLMPSAIVANAVLAVLFVGVSNGNS